MEINKCMKHHIVLALALLCLIGCNLVRQREKHVTVTPPPVVVVPDENGNYPEPDKNSPDAVKEEPKPVVYLVIRGQSERFAIELEKLFITKDFIAADGKYWAVNRKWLFEVYIPSYKQFMIENQIEYTGKFDCDKFSRLFETLALICYSKSEIPTDAEGPAIAEFYYKPDESAMYEQMFHEPAPGHAINVVYLDTGDIIFIEPQNGEEVHLSETEIASCQMVKF